MHVSYLNRDYDTDVLEKKWKASTYSGSDPVWQGTNGYDYISSHLGYRYVLKTSSFSHNRLSITIENKGFSNCYRPVLASLTVASTDHNFQETISIDSDPRTWLSGKSVTLQIPIDTDELKCASYTISLRLTDTTLNREILLASDLPHNTDGYQLGTLTVDTLFSKLAK